MKDKQGYVSPDNRDRGVRPVTVVINDATLREGEQAGEVRFSLKQKVDLARRLDEIGVGEIEIGWPNRSALDREALRLIGGLHARTGVLAVIAGDNWQSEIDASIESKADIVSLLQGTSDIRMEISETSRTAVLDRAVEAVRYAAGRGSLVVYSPTDTTRTNLEFLQELIEASAAAGADRIAISDTVGVASPDAMRNLTSKICHWVDIPVQVHCHNDFGLALANTLAAVEGGATIVDATVNGLGERSGNAALDEVAVGLKHFYGIDTSVQLDQMYSLSRYVQEITGVSLPFNKPLVGDYAFAHKLDIHVRHVMIHPPLLEPMAPQTVGNRRVISLGKDAGPYMMEVKLQQYDLDATALQIELMVEQVRKLAMEKNASLTEEEFLAIAMDVLDS